MMDLVLFLTTQNTSFYLKYVYLWILYCIAALWIIVMDKQRLATEYAAYRKFLMIKWKIATFIPAFLFVTFAGPFTDDETWDIISGSGMSLLTFLTAPWATGVAYQISQKIKPLRYIIVASALCLFSSSWFYDIYLFVRDGSYSSRWVGNLILSPIIYVAAGFFWNLEPQGPSGIRFSFTRPDWPKPSPDTRVRPLLPVAIPIAIIAVLVLVGFVNWHF